MTIGTRLRVKLEMSLYGRRVPRKRGYKPYAYFDSIGRLRFKQVKTTSP